MTGRPRFDIQGHRGARGLIPENTIPSFCAAFAHGLPTVELDVVMSRDGEVVVSHEPWFSHMTSSHPDGRWVTEAEERSLRLLDMTMEQIRTFDCGARGHALFPEQRAEAASKPTLSEVLTACDRFCADRGLASPRYNVEVKSRPDWDHIFTPPPEPLAAAVAAEVAQHGALDRSTLQSFDWRIVVAWHSAGVRADLALLVENAWSVADNLAALGFVPAGYNPHFELVTETLVAEVHGRGMWMVPWTVNDPAAMRRLYELGVDGLITDYPDRARRVFDALAAAH